MQIPVPYLGRWRGQVRDHTRAKPYEGEIVISETVVTTTYAMAHGKTDGDLTLLLVSDGFLVLKEVAASFAGTLLLYLGADRHLRCVWRCGSKFSSEANMDRVADVEADLN